MCDHAGVLKDQHSIANALYHFEYMGTVEDHFSFCGKGLQQSFQDLRRGHIESRERLIENKDLRVMQQSSA